MTRILILSMVLIGAGFFSAAGNVSPGVLSWLILLPLAAALVMIPLKERTARWVALCASALTLGIGFRVFAMFDRAQSGFQFLEEIRWMENLNIQYLLGVDGMSVLMLLLTGFVFYCGVLVAWEMTPRAKEFFIFFCLLVAGVYGVFTSLDLFFFFLFYELAVLPMYLLIGVWGTGPREYAAMKLTLYLLAGSALMLVGFLAMYFASQTPTFDIRVLADPQASGFDLGFQKLWFPILFVGFGVIAALYPFHTWSPDGHSSAPTSVSMLHAGVLMKLGGYGILRIAVPILPEGAREWLPFFALLTIVNVLYGSLAALKQTDLKYVTAYSSVSHCGYVLFGICTFHEIGFNGAVMQMFSHGIMTALFFALIGLIYGRTHTRDIPKLGGLFKVMPAASGIYIAAGMASAGLPGLSGFVAEFLVFLGAYRSGFEGGFPVYRILFPLALLAVFFTALYVLQLLRRVFFGSLPSEYEGHVRDGSPLEIFPLAILLAVLIVVGIYPWPWVDLVQSSVGPLIAHVGGFK